MSQLMTGKQALLEMLKAEGVEYIFGNPGTSEGPIIDLLGDYPELRYILTLQESVAVGMGEAYARATGAGFFCQPSRGQWVGQRHRTHAGRSQYRHPHSGDLRQLRCPQGERVHDRFGPAGPTGHQVGGGTDPSGPDSQCHAAGFQRGQQPSQRPGVRGIHLQRPGGDGRDEHRTLPSLCTTHRTPARMASPRLHHCCSAPVGP